MKTTLDAGLRLFVVCAVAAGTLALVYRGTQARISANQAEEKARRLRWVLPDCPQVEPRTTEGREWFLGRSEGRDCGYAIETKAKGYGGTLSLLVGVSPEGRVLGYSILSHKETPGLGDKAAKPAFQAQFKGLGLEKPRLKKDSPEGALDALTAATITSRAVTLGVREGVERVLALSKDGGRP